MEAKAQLSVLAAPSGAVLRKAPAGLVPLIIVAVLTLSPLAAMVYGAVHPGLFEGHARLSLASLIRTYTSAELWQSLGGTATMAAVVALVSTAAGVALSWLVARTNVPLSRLLEMVIILPLFTSPFIASIAWFAVAAPQSGIVNVVLSGLLGRRMVLLNVTSLGGVAWVLIVHYLPYAYLFAVGALQNIDASLEEAAYLNGSGPFVTFRRVTLPLIFPALASSFIFIMILSAGVFSVPAVL
ncbi:MAG: ABC transporter permease subunit, partial [Chloroflexota bacterium]|nr:ABC transporter permease subunit [Chloroflexota bacterium]